MQWLVLQCIFHKILSNNFISYISAVPGIFVMLKYWVQAPPKWKSLSKFWPATKSQVYNYFIIWITTRCQKKGGEISEADLSTVIQTISGLIHLMEEKLLVRYSCRDKRLAKNIAISNLLVTVSLKTTGILTRGLFNWRSRYFDCLQTSITGKYYKISYVALTAVDYLKGQHFQRHIHH